MNLSSAIYVGHVVHQRHRPKKHYLRYRVFSLLIDLDELPALNRLKWFGHNRRALFSFRDADHGDDLPLRDWVNQKLAGEGLGPASRVRLLCYPRILGYVFNPLTVWFCDDASGRPLATIYEVHNTFRERHSYVLPASAAQAADKAFYVSPFIDMNCRYEFHLDSAGRKGAYRDQRDPGRSAPALCRLHREPSGTDRRQADAPFRDPPTDDPQGHGEHSLRSAAPDRQGHPDPLVHQPQDTAAAPPCPDHRAAGLERSREKPQRFAVRKRDNT